MFLYTIPPLTPFRYASMYFQIVEICKQNTVTKDDFFMPYFFREGEI